MSEASSKDWLFDRVLPGIIIPVAVSFVTWLGINAWGSASAVISKVWGNSNAFVITTKTQGCPTDFQKAGRAYIFIPNEDLADIQKIDNTISEATDASKPDILPGMRSVLMQLCYRT